MITSYARAQELRRAIRETTDRDERRQLEDELTNLYVRQAEYSNFRRRRIMTQRVAH